MESFAVAVNAVVPFLVYISFGYLIKSVGMTDESLLKRLNQLVFKAFFPILMFNNMYNIGSGFVLNASLIAVSLILVLGFITLLFLAVPRIVKGNPQRGVIIQAMYRSNFVLFALPLTISVFGEESATLASMMIAIFIPIYNVAAVIVLEYFRGGELDALTLIKNVCKNPMIIGAAAGLVFFVFRIKLPSPVMNPLSDFAKMTTPLALFVLGGSLHFSEIGGNLRYIIPALFVKMILVPAIAIFVTTGIGLAPVERFVLFTLFATPVAASSYPMAQNMGGDGELAGQFVVISTALSVVTIFGWIMLLKGSGLI